MALGFLDRWSPKSVSVTDEDIINKLYEWTSGASLPSPVIADISDPELSDGMEVDSFYRVQCPC